MPREILIAEARAAGQAARKNLAWMDKHPDRFDQSKADDMRDYLHMLIAFSKNEQKNTRSAKRALVSSSIKGFIVSIIPYAVRRVLVK